MHMVHGEVLHLRQPLLVLEVCFGFLHLVVGARHYLITRCMMMMTLVKVNPAHCQPLVPWFELPRCSVSFYGEGVFVPNVDSCSVQRWQVWWFYFYLAFHGRSHTLTYGAWIAEALDAVVLFILVLYRCCDCVILCGSLPLLSQRMTKLDTHLPNLVPHSNGWHPLYRQKINQPADSSSPHHRGSTWTFLHPTSRWTDDYFDSTR